MKKVFLATALALILMAPGALWAQLTLKDGQLQYKDGGASKSFPVDKGAVQPILNSTQVFISLSEPAVLKAVDREPGLFFFDRNGALLGHYPGREGFDPEMCAAASLSPGGKVIALDNGTWVVRVWTFLNYPSLTPVNPKVEEPFISYLSAGEPDGRDLVWLDDDTVIVTDISEAPVSRPCPADPCEPWDVVVHHLKAWKSAALARGSELCNYSFKALEGRTVTVNKICTKKIEDWGEDVAARGTVTEEKVKVPSSSF